MFNANITPHFIKSPND